MDNEHITAPESTPQPTGESKPALKSDGQQMGSTEAAEKVAKDLIHKFIDVEQQEVTTEDEIPMQILNTVEDGMGKVRFVSEGEDKVLTIRPADTRLKYSMIILDDKGNELNQIPNLNGVSKTRIKLLRGNYDIMIRTERGENVPFIIQSDS